MTKIALSSAYFQKNKAQVIYKAPPPSPLLYSPLGVTQETAPLSSASPSLKYIHSSFQIAIL